MKKILIAILSVILIAGCTKKQTTQVTNKPVLVKVGSVTDVTTVYTEVRVVR